MTPLAQTKMFGTTTDKVLAEYMRLLDMYGTDQMVLTSMLSDVQQMIEAGLKEDARQALNRVKYNISHRVKT